MSVTHPARASGYSPWRPLDKISLILLDLIQILLEICLGGVYKFRLVDELPSNEKYWANTDHGVAEQKVGNVPESRQKHRVTTHKCHDEAHYQCVPRAVWLPERLVWERIAADALGSKCLSELEVGYAHNAEIDELRCSDLAMVKQDN